MREKYLKDGEKRDIKSKELGAVLYLIDNYESPQNLQAKIQILTLRILRQVASEPTSPIPL